MHQSFVMNTLFYLDSLTYLATLKFGSHLHMTLLNTRTTIAKDNKYTVLLIQSTTDVAILLLNKVKISSSLEDYLGISRAPSSLIIT